MTQQQEDFYKILQVDPSADPEVVTAAYRRLAVKYHPDTNSSPDALPRMQKINEAYSVLSDPKQRAAYDRSRGYGAGYHRAAAASKRGEGSSMQEAEQNYIRAKRAAEDTWKRAQREAEIDRDKTLREAEDAWSRAKRVAEENYRHAQRDADVERDKALREAEEAWSRIKRAAQMPTGKAWSPD